MRNTVVRKSGPIIYLAYAFMVLLLGLIAHSQFEDLRVRETGTIVQGTIETSHSGKSMASGIVDYRLPTGENCRDYTELGPNSDIHAGEEISLAAGESCGHPVSAKKRLWPWMYLFLCLGSAFHLLFIARRADRSENHQEAREL